MPTLGLLFFLLLLSLWDIYLPSLGIRPLDFLMLFVIGLKVVWDLTGKNFYHIKSDQLTIYSFLGFWCVGYSVVGLVDSIDNLKPVVGFILGYLVFGFFYFTRINRQSILYCISFIIVVHVCYFILQMAYYYISGEVLNIYGGFGLEPRALSSIFRPTGLYLEPASYAVSMLMLLALRALFLDKPDALFYVAIGTVVLSLSIWGILASSIFLLFAVRASPLVILSILVGLVLCVILFSDNQFIISIFDAFFFPRIQDFGNDNSAVDRYGGLMDLMNLSWNSIFGMGVSNEYHIFGSSGLSFIVAAGGLVGLIIFLSLLALLNQGSQVFIKLALLVIFLTAAPMWNTFFWWS
ncbi:MAG: hypothetical protein EBX50_23015, partial [Chitinophagia bacterium]|nr:hypothetical protein [Chitinophagia bacterium]